MERGSELNPIDVAVGAALGGDDVGGEVGPIKEPPGTKDGSEVEDQEVIGRGKRGAMQRHRGLEDELDLLSLCERIRGQSVCAVNRQQMLIKGCGKGDGGGKRSRRD